MTSVGAVLADIRADSGMSGVLASIVVAAPVWCFALGGGLAYKLRAAWGTSRTVTLALVMLAATLATRVIAGPYLLLAGTVVACLSIAVLGTLLPVITHAAPTKAWALLTGCYIAAMGGGSGLGALITPQVSGGSSWQWGVSAWALLAAAALVAWRVATRRFTEPEIAAGPRPSPFTLRPPSTAWSTTLHFGLTSGFTFTIMGWLPSILLDHSHVDATMVGWMFGVAMALGVPIALLVPKWARASQSQSALAVVLCVPNMLAMGGLLLYPEITPWVWAIALGLGMPAVGLGLTLISLRAAPDGDTAAALSSMVQGFGYAIAGATALGAGLLHSSTQGWEWPLIGLLVVLCGQLITGMHAGLPTTVYSGRRFAPSVERPEPRRAPVTQVPWQASGGGPLPMSGPGVGWGPPGAPPAGSAPSPVAVPGAGSGPRPFPSPRPAPEPIPLPEPVTEPVRPLRKTVEPVTQAVEPVDVTARADTPVAEPETVPETASVAEPVVVEPEVVSLAEAASVAEPAVAESVAVEAGAVVSPTEVVPVAEPVVAGSVVEPEVVVDSAAVEAVAEAEVAADMWIAAVEAAELVNGSVLPVVDHVGGPERLVDAVLPDRVESGNGSVLPVVDHVGGPERLVDAVLPEPIESGNGSVLPVVDHVDPPEPLADAALPDQVESANGKPEADATDHVLNGIAVADVRDRETSELVSPRQEALFDIPQQEALFEIPLPRQPMV